MDLNQRNMKSLIFAFLAIFLMTSCATTKRTSTSKIQDKKHIELKESTKDSVTSVKVTLPTNNEMVFDLEKISSTSGDFTTKTSSGDGNEAIIEKKGTKLYVKTKTPGSKEINTSVNQTEKEVIYDSEFVVSETKKLVKRIPFKFWLIIGIVLVIYFRKFITEILTALFPALKTKRLFALILGIK